MGKCRYHQILSLLTIIKLVIIINITLHIVSNPVKSKTVFVLLGWRQSIFSLTKREYQVCSSTLLFILFGKNDK